MAPCHVRAVSLPSIEHPFAGSIEEHLCKLKASVQSSSPMHNKLCGLKDLYECVDAFLQLPRTQQTLFGELGSEHAEELLSGSLMLLDVCCTTRDIFFQAKECVQELELSVRRSRGEKSVLAADVVAYIASRKQLNKVIRMCLRSMNRKEKSCCDNSNLMTTIRVLKDVEEISAASFESILSFLSHPKSKTKPNSVILSVSKFLTSKHTSSKGKVDTSEDEKINAWFLAFKSSKDISSLQVETVLKGLKTMEGSIQQVEEELESLYRQLVKARVSLLNILNH